MLTSSFGALAVDALDSQAVRLEEHAAALTHGTDDFSGHAIQAGDIPELILPRAAHQELSQHGPAASGASHG